MFASSLPLSRLRTSRRVRIVVVALCGAVLLPSAVYAGTARAATLPAAQPLAPPVPPTSGLLFGAFTGATSTQTASQAFASLESRTGRTLAVDRSYSRWDDVQPTPIVVDDGAHDRIPVLSIKPQLKNGTIISWASVASGSQDDQIRAQADGLRDSGIPLILTFHHEPEFATGYGTAADYVAAFRHYVAVFRAEHATNVAFSVILGAGTYQNPSAWYPGDDVVDWIGADAYNFAACAPGLPAWRSLAQAAGAFYQWGAARGKPLLLAEWGSAEDPAQPGRKAAWLNDAATTLAGWPQVKAAAYFDRVGSCDWRLTTSTSALTAFNTLAQSPLANGAPTGRLLPGSSIGPAPYQRSFDLRASTGGGSSTGTGITAWSLDFGDGSPAQTGTGQPGWVGHTYGAGHWTATLTVTDAAGRQATTSAAVISAPAPVVSQGAPSPLTSTGTTLPAWIDTNSLTGSYYMQWGTTTSYGSRSTSVSLPALDYSQAVTQTVSGLQPATRYHWRVVATSAAGTTFGPDRYFDTPA